MDLEAGLLLLPTFTILITAMRKPLLLTSLLIALVFACNQHPEKSKNELLKPSALASSFFTIDITKDTTLKTQKGAIIKIPKGALVAEGPSIIQLEVKEVYTIREMIVAGLITQSNGEPLSSGGMIYINAVGENTVRVEKPMSVSIPTDWVNKDMQLFKGEVQSDSSINWINPDTIPAGASEKYLEAGKIIFDNCVRCHEIGRELTGPDLAHVDKRWQEGGPTAYDFTWNSQKVLAEGDGYYNCLYEKYNRSPMPAFPGLTREEMNALYDYIENESYARGIPYPKDRDACYDSCGNYSREKEKLGKIKDSSVADYLAPDTTPANPVPGISTQWQDLVSTTLSEPVYYEFNIEALGWFNVDILMKNNPAFVDTELRIRIQGTYKTSISVYLAIPSIRAFIDGGLLEGKDDEYGFFTKDGKIPLPPNAEAYIIAMAEANGKILYNSKAFITTQSKQLELSLKEVTREKFDEAIKSLGFEDFNITIVDAKKAAEERERLEDSVIIVEESKMPEAEARISNIDRRIDSLRPKSKKCDCICAGMERRSQPDSAN
jgi:mono/diheme cytochrome c family protein